MVVLGQTESSGATSVVMSGIDKEYTFSLLGHDSAYRMFIDGLLGHDRAD